MSAGIRVPSLRCAVVAASPAHVGPTALTSGRRGGAGVDEVLHEPFERGHGGAGGRP